MKTYFIATGEVAKKKNPKMTGHIEGSPVKTLVSAFNKAQAVAKKEQAVITRIFIREISAPMASLIRKRAKLNDALFATETSIVTLSSNNSGCECPKPAKRKYRKAKKAVKKVANKVSQKVVKKAKPVKKTIKVSVPPVALA